MWRSAGDVGVAEVPAVCDINERMLSVGRGRAVKRGMEGGIDWVVGNAEVLPLADRLLTSTPSPSASGT